MSQDGWIFYSNGTSATLFVPEKSIAGYNTLSCPFTIDSKYRPSHAVEFTLAVKEGTRQSAYLHIGTTGTPYIQGWGGTGGTVSGQATWPIRV